MVWPHVTTDRRRLNAVNTMTAIWAHIRLERGAKYPIDLHVTTGFGQFWMGKSWAMMLAVGKWLILCEGGQTLSWLGCWFMLSLQMRKRVLRDCGRSSLQSTFGLFGVSSVSGALKSEMITLFTTLWKGIGRYLGPVLWETATKQLPILTQFWQGSSWKHGQYKRTSSI
jgi:hypothetical protein